MTITRNGVKAIVKPEGLVEYNGVVFNELIKTKLDIRAVENHSGTGIKYEEYVFTIEALVTPKDLSGLTLSYDPDNYKLSPSNVAEYSSDSFERHPGYIYDRTANSPEYNTTDSPFRMLRRHLMQPGGRFVYMRKGAGEDLIFDSNATDGARRQDICFGPMPKTISFELVAGARAARIVFQVLVRTKHCTGKSNLASSGIVDLSVYTNIKTNANGYKVINRKGYLEIAMPRNHSSQSAFDSGSIGSANYPNTHLIEEKYKEVLQNLIGINMQGYTVEHDVKFSPDHRSCEFNILYTEIESPNAYPNGVTKIQCTHNLKSTLYGDTKNPYGTVGYGNWLNTMSASITLRPNVNPLKAWYIFLQVLNERLKYEIASDVDYGDFQRVKVPLILDIELEENIFSHEYRFKVTWMIYINNLSKLWDKTNFLRPLESTDWFDWTTDQRLAVNSVNGAYPLVPGKTGTDYYSTNLCNQDSMYLHYTINLETTRGYPEEFIQDLFGTNCPPENSSWVDYQRKFYVVGTVGEETYQRYRDPNSSSVNRLPLSDDPRDNKELNMLDYYVDSPETDYYTQDFRRDQFDIIERGYAIRLGGPTQPNVWKEIGGKKVKLIPGADIISNHVISATGDCPMVATTWERRYRILGKPDGDITTNKKESASDSRRK
jgi:hypothetical protein